MLQNELNSIWPGWTIKAVLGEGAYGKVYLIEREDFGHVYSSALKVIKIPQSEAEVTAVRNDGLDESSVSFYFKSIVEDIVEEFALMSRLKGNSNIVSYEDHAVIPHKDDIGWTILIRMEYLTPLYKHVANHSLYTEDVINLGIDICKALEVCQKYKIIHRDIKPENLFVSDVGKFKLGDFGISRQLEKTNSALSKKGTYTYMAPEVFKGEDYNNTVDLYSLGIVLYRFLNKNRTPFLPPYPEPVDYIQKEMANRKRFMGEEFPKPCMADGDLARVVMKACAYDPKERYQDAAQLRMDLERIKNGEKVPAGGGKAGKSPVKEKEKKKNGKIGIAAIAAAVVLLAAVLGMTVLRKPVVPDLYNMTLQQIEEQDYPFEIVEVEGQFSDEIEKGHVILQSIVPGEKAAKNTAIEVVVSLGKGVAFPDLTGKSEEEVQMILKDAGFVYLQGEREVSEEIEAGYVIYCETLDGKVISAGDMVEENAQIVVIYSFGAGQVEVPDVEGDSLEDAQEKLTNSNLKYKVKKVYHNSIQKGKVVSQNIGAGQFVEAGTEIELTISLGKKNTYTPSTSKPKTETQTPEEGSGETENVEGEVPEGEGTETPGDSVVPETPSTEIPESDAGQDAPVVESTDPQVPETSGEESQ